MTRLSEVERVALEDIFILLPNRSFFQKVVYRVKSLFL